MAVKVIKHGNKRTVECNNCGCLFEYEKEDVSTLKTGFNEYEYFIDCPDCRQQITVDYFK